MKNISTYQKSVFLKSEHWNEIKLSGEYVSNRTNATLFTYKNRIYLFGGDEIEGNTNDDDFLYFDFGDASHIQNTLKWKKVEQVNPQEGPGKLERHTVNLIGQKIYIFGGKQSLFKSSDILYTLDLETGVWDQTQSQGKVPCLDSHTTCTWKFSEEDQNKFYQQQKQQNSQENSENNENNENKEQQQQTIEIDKDVELIVYGGFNITGYQNQLYSYKLQSKQWEEIIPASNNNIPKNRSNHTACIFKDHMYVFGGTNGHERFDDFFMFDLNSKIWTQIKGENSPCGRSGHTMNIYGNQLVIFGGLKSLMNELNDLYTFDISTQKWRLLEKFSDYTTQYPLQVDKINTKLEKSGNMKSSKSIKPSSYLNIKKPHHKRFNSHQRKDSISTQDSRDHQTGTLQQDTIQNSQFFPKSHIQENIRSPIRKPTKSQIVRSPINSNRKYHSSHQNPSQEDFTNRFYNHNYSTQTMTKKQLQEEMNFGLFRDTTLNNHQMNKYFGHPKERKNLGLNTLYGNMRKIKISPLLNYEQKKDKIKDTQKQIMMKEFEQITIEEGEENPITQSMRNAITGVQKKTTQDAVKVILNDQRTVMKITNIVDTYKNRIFSKKPMPRDGHTACIINDKLILFGGDRHRLTFNDTYELDLKSVLHSQFNI